jgi:WD40 repeat protein
MDNSDISSLSGIFISPDDNIKQIGHGTVLDIVPVLNDFLLIISTGDTFLYSIREHKIIWTIICQAIGGGIDIENKRLILAHKNKIILWNLDNGSINNKIIVQNRISKIKINSKHRKIYILESYKNFSVLDYSGKVITRHQFDHRVTCFAISDDGNMLAVGISCLQNHCSVKVFDAENFTEKHTINLECHSFEEFFVEISSILFSPCRRYIAVAHNLKSDRPGDHARTKELLTIWDFYQKKSIKTKYKNKDRHGLDLAFSSNNKLLALAVSREYNSPGGVILFFLPKLDATSNHIVFNESPSNSNIYLVRFIDNDSKLVIVGDDQCVRFIDAKSGDECQRIVGFSNEIINLAPSHDGKYLLSNDSSGTSILLDVCDGKEVWRCNTNFYKYFTRNIYPFISIKVGKKSKKILGGYTGTEFADENTQRSVSIDSDRPYTYLRYSLPSPNYDFNIEQSYHHITAYSMSPDCSIVAYSLEPKRLMFPPYNYQTSNLDMTRTAILLKHVINSDKRKTIPGTWPSSHNGRINHLLFSFNSRLLVSVGKDGKIIVWKIIKEYGNYIFHGINHNEYLRLIPQSIINTNVDKILGIRFSLDNKYIAYLCGDFSLRIFSIDDKEEIRRLENVISTDNFLYPTNYRLKGSGQNQVFCFVGDKIAVGNDTGTINFYDYIT